MWLLVGLGNPGGEYARNRHNIGFRVLDHLAERSTKPVVWKEKWGAAVGEAQLAAAGSEKLLLCKPMEFMNVSGQAVSRVASFWKVPVSRTVVVYDEIDLPFAKLRIASGGGHGGHNGVRSLITELPESTFARVRFGVGRPPAGRDAAAWVLANFSKEEEMALPDLITRAGEAMQAVVSDGATAAMNKFNGEARPAKARKAEGPPASEGAAARDPKTQN